MNQPGRALIWLVGFLASAGDLKAEVCPPNLRQLPEHRAAGPPSSSPPVAGPSGRSAPVKPVTLVERSPTGYPDTMLRAIADETTPPSARSAVLTVYQRAQGEYQWSDGMTLSAAGQQMIRLIQETSLHGISVQGLVPQRLARLVDALAWNAQLLVGSDTKENHVQSVIRLRRLLFADLDAQLTASALAYAARMGGRSLEGAELADRLASKQEREEWVTSLVPWHPQYHRLLPVLARYQRYAAGEGFVTLEPGPDLRVGDEGSAVSALRRRLRQEAYESAVREDDAPFGNALRQDLRDFQYSRGLPVTGVLNEETRDALNVSLPSLVRQIQDTLWQWRVSPTRGEQTFLQVNLPEFVVELYRGRERQMRHRAVIGYAFGTGGGRTKRFHSQVEQVVLNPGWTPSERIINNNLLPREEATPGYLARRGFRWFTRPSGERGLYQNPGPDNTLGRVKLQFPNENNIYLHGSPDQDQFELASRATSNGCVRVQDIEALALELLQRANMMDRSEFEAALQSQRTQEIQLSEPLPIHFEYAMVVVDDDQSVRFLPNVYRQRIRR